MIFFSIKCFSSNLATFALDPHEYATNTTIFVLFTSLTEIKIRTIQRQSTSLYLVLGAMAKILLIGKRSSFVLEMVTGLMRLSHVRGLRSKKKFFSSYSTSRSLEQSKLSSKSNLRVVPLSFTT